jgi:hypothetical protein
MKLLFFLALCSLQSCTSGIHDSVCNVQYGLPDTAHTCGPDDTIVGAFCLKDKTIRPAFVSKRELFCKPLPYPCTIQREEKQHHSRSDTIRRIRME